MANAWDLHIFGNVWCPKSQANQTYQWWWVDITFAQDRVFSTSYIYNRNVFIYEPCMPPCNSHRRFHRASWKALLRRLGVESVVTTERYQNAQNQSCFKGSRSLKGTQVYPKEFGRCVPSWDLNSWHSQKYTNYRVYIYICISRSNHGRLRLHVAMIFMLSSTTWTLLDLWWIIPMTRGMMRGFFSACNGLGNWALD